MTEILNCFEVSFNEELSFSTGCYSRMYVETVLSICPHSVSCGLSQPDRLSVQGPTGTCVTLGATRNMKILLYTWPNGDDMQIATGGKRLPLGCLLRWHSQWQPSWYEFYDISCFSLSTFWLYTQTSKCDSRFTQFKSQNKWITS